MSISARSGMLKFLNLTGRISSALFLGLALCTSLALAEGDKFEFKYNKGKPLTYDFTFKISMATSNQILGQVESSRMAFTMTYRAEMTPVGDPVKGVTTLHYEPSKIGGHWDVDSAGAKVEMTLKDKHMKGFVNGEPFIDTEKGMGIEEAEDIKKEIEALYLSGKIALDGEGRVKKFDGNQEFIDFWT